MADENWMRFMSYIHQNGGWTGIEPDWDTRAPSDGTGWGQVVEKALADAEDSQGGARVQILDALRTQGGAEGVVEDERGANVTWRDAI